MFTTSDIKNYSYNYYSIQIKNYSQLSLWNYARWNFLHHCTKKSKILRYQLIIDVSKTLLIFIYHGFASKYLSIKFVKKYLFIKNALAYQKIPTMGNNNIYW